MATGAESLRTLAELYERAAHNLDVKALKPFMLNQASHLRFEQWPVNKRASRFEKAVSRYVEQTAHYLENVITKPPIASGDPGLHIIRNDQE